MKYLPIIIVIFSLLTSCFSIKPGVTKTGKNLWEEFYVSPGVTQYFIKPLLFKAGNSQFRVDFTFRNSSDSVTVNFTANLLNLSDTQKDLRFCSTKDTIQVKKTQAIFQSTSKSEIYTRESAKIEFSEFIRLMKEIDWNVKSSNAYLYPTKKTENSLDKLKNNLFQLF